jgi:hypothetical protein
MPKSSLKRLQSWPDKMQEDVLPEGASPAAKSSTMTIPNCEAEKLSRTIGYSVQRCLPRWMRRRMRRPIQHVAGLDGLEALLTDLCSTFQAHSAVQELDQFWVVLPLKPSEVLTLIVATTKSSDDEECLVRAVYP